MKLLTALAVTLVLATLADCGRKDRECNRLCHSSSSPVCAWRRRGGWKTFDNDCALVVYNCENQDVYEFVSFGACN